MAESSSNIAVIYRMKLKDEATFDPMTLLELLKQSCSILTTTSGFTCKAYQGKELYSNFFILSGEMGPNRVSSQPGDPRIRSKPSALQVTMQDFEDSSVAYSSSSLICISSRMELV